MTELELLSAQLDQLTILNDRIEDVYTVLFQISQYLAYAVALYFFIVAVKAIYYLFGRVFFGGI
jgi:hypothetical protein